MAIEAPFLAHLRLVVSQSHITPQVLEHQYSGSGTEEDPYIVEFLHNDPRNPRNFPIWGKWFITILVAVATLGVTFDSSAYTGGIRHIMQQFSVSQEVATLGVSLFVLGFAIGPLLWAPLSELYGRQIVFIATYGVLTVLCAGAAGSQNIQTLIALRAFAGAFGSSPLTNAGGVIADLFAAEQRGLATALFAAAPFLGPTLGPIVGGFLGETEGWRWIIGLMAIFSGVMWILCTLMVPETYAPVLLSMRAKKLSNITGRIYKSRLEFDMKNRTASQVFETALARPWALLLREPIVLLLSTYMAIGFLWDSIYDVRSISDRIPAGSGLEFGHRRSTFLWRGRRYIRAAERTGGRAPPEQRLPPVMVGSVFLPLGLFWFAWTNYPSIHWIVSTIATVPFGFGMVLVFLGIINYLVDAYTIYTASVLAANSVLRSVFGAVFPLFTTYMFTNLGIHWASSIPAFLSLLCVPFPFLFFKYGPAIRKRCKYAADAARIMGEVEEEEPEEESGGKSTGQESIQ
ncbi:related to synaptic vesicle transporter SVOP and related transporters (major facilitator superfamily) [Phialocephala subalpina]|uniref:Related to synaptic vesicle transporter SVOP and related transporters (Major facilitator superfamily) n=1 Tax=Phialocephala subalpina TaxID=576137 RepID=A0A1L7XQW2_9HELO|nr:related to synaptic vesicle transporter SVOP and related transporters (major facilitator superfamily) [Phialocephala subalpina]